MNWNSNLILLLSFLSCSAWAQSKAKITVIEFVEILEDQKKEALYYYENNWKLLRVAARAEGYIDSFQMIEIAHSQELPAHLLLITNFKDKAQYEAAEGNFKKLMAGHGEMRLLNHQQPDNFRKNLMHKVSVRNH